MFSSEYEQIAKSIVVFKRTRTNDQFNAFLHGMRVGYTSLNDRQRGEGEASSSSSSSNDQRRRRQRFQDHQEEEEASQFQLPPLAPLTPPSFVDDDYGNDDDDLFGFMSKIGDSIADKAAKATALPQHASSFEEGRQVGNSCVRIAEAENLFALNNEDSDDKESFTSTGSRVAFSVFNIYDQLLTDHPQWHENFPQLNIPLNSSLAPLFVSDVDLLEAVTQLEQDTYFLANSESMFSTLQLQLPRRGEGRQAFDLLNMEFSTAMNSSPFLRFLTNEATRIGIYDLDAEHVDTLRLLLELVRADAIDIRKLNILGINSTLPMISYYGSQTEGREAWLARKLLFVSQLRTLSNFQRGGEDAYLYFLLLPFILHVCQRITNIHREVVSNAVNLPSIEGSSYRNTALRYLRYYNEECNRVFLDRRFHTHVFGFHSPTIDENTSVGFNACVLHVDKNPMKLVELSNAHIKKELERMHKPPAGSTIDYDNFFDIIETMGRENYLDFSFRQAFTWIFERRLTNAIRVKVTDTCMIISLMAEAERRSTLIGIANSSPHGRIPRYMFVGFIARESNQFATLDYTTHVLENHVLRHNLSGMLDFIPSRASPYYPASVYNISSVFKRDHIFENLKEVVAVMPTLVFADDDSIASRIGECRASSSFSPVTTATSQRIVLRKASYLDMRPKADESLAALEHVVASEDTAIGEHIGHAVYEKETGKTKLLRYNTQATRSRLENFLLANNAHSDVRGFSGELVTLDEASMAPKTLVIELVIEYKSNLNGDGMTEERPYKMFIYLSQSFQVSTPFIFDTTVKGKQNVRLLLKVRQSTIPEHTNINFDSYALYTNDDGVVGINQAGFASIRLAKLANAKTSQKFMLLVPTSMQKVVKATIDVQCRSVSLPFDVPVVEDKAILAEKKKTDALVNAYIHANREFYKKYPPLFSSLKYVTVFQYHCRTGVVPGSLFDMFRLPASREEFYVNAMRVSIQRLLPSTEINDDVYAIWSAMDEQLKLRAAMSALTIYANTCTYSQDAIDNNVSGKRWSRLNIELIDSFDTLRHTQTADCEDKDQEIIQEASEIKYNRKYFQSALMREVRALFKRFIFFSTLCCVSKGAISYSELAKNNHSLVAHECAVAIPNYTFFEALRRSDPNHILLSSYSEKTRNLGRADRIYILEGTGNLAPEPREESERRKEVGKHLEHFSEKATSLLFEQYFYTVSAASKDGFYKIFVNLMTPEFFVHRGLPCVEFLLVGKNNRRGVFFSEILEIDKYIHVHILETPRIPLLTFNKSMRRIDDNFPQIPLEACVQEVDVTEEMRAIARRLTCVNNSSREIPRHEDCDIRQCRFEYMTEERITALLRDSKNNDINILCRIEALSRNFIDGRLFGCYTLFFY